MQDLSTWQHGSKFAQRRLQTPTTLDAAESEAAEAVMAKLRVCSFSFSTDSLTEGPREISAAFRPTSPFAFAEGWRAGVPLALMVRGLVMTSPVVPLCLLPPGSVVGPSASTTDTTSRLTSTGWCFFHLQGKRQP